MLAVDVQVTVETESLAETERQAESEIAAQMVAGVRDVLAFTENVQIKKYTESDHPPRLKYQRTFRLQRASRTDITETRLPVIKGQWDVDEGEAPYAEEVIGPRSSQKAIHRGRWLSQEDIEKETQDHAEEIMAARINT